MKVIKDNYLEKVFERIRPAAKIGAVLVSTLILSGVLLAALGNPGVAAVAVFAIVSTIGIAAVAKKYKVRLIRAGSALALVTALIAQLGAVAGASGSEVPKHLQPALKWPVEKKQIAVGINLNTGGNPTILGSQNVATPFPFGDGYRTLFLEISINLTVGTGTGAISEGELLFIKNLYLKTDKHGPIVDNVCGRALYYRARKVMRTAPYKDAIAATTATYTVSLPIHFANSKLRRPQDSLLNMKDVQALELDITLGSVSDLLTSPGTATVTATVDIAVEKTKKPIDEGSTPVFQPYLAMLGPIDPSVLQYLEVPKIKDLSFTDLMLFVSNSASAGIPWSGTPSNNTLSRITLEDNLLGKTFDQVTFLTILNDNKLKFELETRITGQAILDVSEDDSVWESYAAGDKAKLQANWINGTLSTSQVSALMDGLVSIKLSQKEQQQLAA